MITMSELLKDKKLEDQTQEIQDNLKVLLERINKVRTAYSKPMTVTSGLRTMEDHLRIYKEMGITDKAKIPMKSNHLKGAACDISDPDGKLYDWTKLNEKLMEQIGLWMEIKDTQKRVHYQIFSPASGARFFHP